MNTKRRAIFAAKMRVLKGKWLKLGGRILHDETLFLQGAHEEFHGKMQLKYGCF